MFGVPTEEQLAKINKLAKRELSADEVFTFSSKLAGDTIIPDRYIKLDKGLLDVFMGDAKKGVSLLLDHSWSSDGLLGMGGRPKAAIPYGRTFDSRYETATEEGETISLMGDHYMVRDIEIDNIKTNDLIASIEAGTLFDTSIGFNYGRCICSVCGEDYRKCNHYQGKTYEVEENGITKNKLCYVMAKPPGALWENSLVFDGAYPGAGVLSKGDIVENKSGVFQVVTDLKNIDPEKQMVATYSNRTGLMTLVKKAEHKKTYNLGGIEKGEKTLNEELKKMIETFGITYEEGKTTFEELCNEMAGKWDGVKETIKASVTPSIAGEKVPEVYLSKEQAKDALGAEISANNVLKLAKEGQEYHKELSADALAMGVRAMGNDFPKETWDKSFANMETKSIKDIMKTWELQAKSDIPTGRHTDPESKGKKQSKSIPKEAFKI